jgi:hypothetical protein
LTEEPQRRQGERGNSESLSALLAIGCNGGKIFRQGYKKIFSLVMEYSALFSTIIEALNLILEKNI